MIKKRIHHLLPALFSLFPLLAAAGARAQAVYIPPTLSFGGATDAKRAYPALSGSALTTTGSVASGSAALTVASALDFRAGQGVFIAGAGAAGANLVTTVSAVSGTTITLAATASATVAGAKVQHDDTAAIQAAISATVAAGGGTLLLPAGRYRVNGPRNTTYNSILYVPYVQTSTAPLVNLCLRGAVPVSGSAYIPYSATTPVGTILDCSDSTTAASNYPALLSATAYSDTNTGYPNCFSAVCVTVEDMDLRFGIGSGYSGINLHNAADACVNGVNLESGQSFNTSGFARPPAGSIGVILPGVNNYGVVTGRNVTVCGTFDVGMRFSEHTLLTSPCVVFCNVGAQVEKGCRPGHLIGGVFEENPVQVQWVQGASSVDLTMDFEDQMTGTAWYALSRDLDDPSAYGRGQVRYNTTAAGVGFTPVNATVTGGANLQLFNLYSGSTGAVASLLAPFTDNFDSNALNARWAAGTLTVSVPGTGASVANVNQEVEVTLPTSTVGDGVVAGTANMAGHSFSAQVVQVATAGATANTQCDTVLNVAPGTSGLTYIHFIYEGGTLYAAYRNGGGDTTHVVASATYSATTQAYWRIREASGVTYFEVSANGSSWSELNGSAHVADPMTMTAMKLSLEAGVNTTAPTTPSKAIFDNASFG